MYMHYYCYIHDIVYKVLILYHNYFYHDSSETALYTHVHVYSTHTCSFSVEATVDTLIR